MASILRTIYDRLVQFPDRFKLTVVPGQPDTYSIVPVPGTVTQAGTPINKGLLQPIVDSMHNSVFFNPYANSRIFTTSTTWTMPAGVSKIGLWLVGAGGGGDSGGGGGGFCLAVREIDAVPGQQITVIIGAGVQGGDGGSTQVLGFVALGGRAGEGTRGGDGSNGGGGASSNSQLNGGKGGTGGTNGGPGTGSVYGSNGGRSLGTSVNPFDGKRYAGGGAGEDGTSTGVAYGGFADVGPGGNSRENGHDGGGGGGGVVTSGTTKGGNGLAIIYY